MICLFFYIKEYQIINDYTSTYTYIYINILWSVKIISYPFICFRFICQFNIIINIIRYAFGIRNLFVSIYIILINVKKWQLIYSIIIYYIIISKNSKKRNGKKKIIQCRSKIFIVFKAANILN